MKVKQNVAKNAILNMIKTIFSIIFPLISFPYVSDVLDVDNLGIYNFSVSIVSYFLLIAALGISTYAIREGSKCRDDDQKITVFVSQIFTINVVSTVVSYVLLLIFLLVTPFMHGYVLPVLILSIEIAFTTIGVSWLSVIYEDFLFITLRTILMQLVALIATFIFVRDINDLYIYLIIVVVANSGANLFNFFYARKKYCKFGLTVKCNWKQHLKPIMIIFSTMIAMTVYISSDTTILGFMTSDHEVGLYGTATKIYSLAKNVFAALLMVMIPRFSIGMSENNKDKMNDNFSQLFKILSLVLVPSVVGLFMLSKDVILLISRNNENYLGADNALKILCVAALFSLYAYMYIQCVLIPVKKENVVLKITIFSAVVNIVLNLILIPYWGIEATAATTVIAEFITFIAAFYYSKNYIALINVGKSFISIIIGSIGIAVICILLKNIDIFLLRIFLSIFLSVIEYCIVMYVFKNKEFTMGLDMILKRVKK